MLVQFSKKVQQIRCSIIDIFKIDHGLEFAEQLLAAFDYIIKQECFDKADILNDLSNTAKSRIAQSVWDDIKDIIQGPNNTKEKIAKKLKDIARGKGKLFSVGEFTFTIKVKDQDEASGLINEENFPLLYNQACRVNKIESSNKRAIVAEDKTLVIAKAVDLKNGYPILLWLLDSYSRDRINRHQALYCSADLSSDKYSFQDDRYCIDYNATRWWLDDNTFCKYIQYRNAKMALPLMSALQAISKRVLLPINFNPEFCQIINDDLNQFAKYALVSWSLAHFAIQEMPEFDVSYAPCQIDWWIIPQCVRQSKLKLVVDEETEDVISSFKTVLKKAEYKETKDYWCENAETSDSKLFEQCKRMWIKADGNKKPYQRCIFIVDRRKSQDVKEKDTHHVSQNCFQTSSNCKDQIYVIIPKPLTSEMENSSTPKISISENFERIPEVGLELVHQHILHSNEKSKHIKFTDEFSGYEFCLSYQLYARYQAKAYWFLNNAGQRFCIKDINWLWPRYFCTIYNSEQKMNEENMVRIEEYQKDKKLPDAKFEEFRKQCGAMRIHYG